MKRKMEKSEKTHKGATIACTGRLLVRLVMEADMESVSSWEQRSATLESFYYESNTW